MRKTRTTSYYADSAQRTFTKKGNSFILSFIKATFQKNFYLRFS